MACERTSETIKIETVQILDKKQLKSWSMAKMCSLFSEQGQENLNVLHPEQCQITS